MVSHALSINKVSINKNVQLDGLFPQFPKLAPELRLLVWTHTWPAPRMIESALCEHEIAPDEYRDIIILRFAGPLSVVLDDDWFLSKAVEEGPLVHCRPPVSLQVCRESRMHTLSHYRRIEHTAAKEGSFYFNPYRDVLWLSTDFTDVPEYLQQLTQCYGEQLNGIETLLVGEAQWDETTPAQFTSSYLEPFGGLEAILLLLYTDDEDGYEGTEDGEDAENADGENGGGVGGLGSDRGEVEARELHARADKFKADYTEFSEHHKRPAKSFRCVDSSLTFY
ncbi:hypothetical protein OIDMADRAFT_181579 [Oidiodendron maius Zn]|uniref:2EXR domain-containing protein n=1 Tax=Oidiodendron maius (strain Zn) TaxID=913774 RepID=A0A0C3H7F2_OIDMZ|nr:hypothetical protein OIDMADRAFT_181579 [Oidiodendron maius Zn]